MPERLRTVLQHMSGFWSKLTTGKRVALVGVTSAVLILVSAIAVLGNRENYAYLYTELSTEDAAAIVDKLKTQQIPYKIEASGTALMVPEEKVAGLRLELASSGLPRGGRVGFEIFDQSRIGATEFEQQVSLRRALEGELARSVLAIHGIKSARVHLVMPERRLFTARSEAASASVVIGLAPSAAFGRREIATIVHLVSAAVPGLSKDRVSVVSTEGSTLHRPVSDGGDAGDLTDMQLSQREQARTMATRYESDVLAQVERVVGPGNADVRVNVELDTSTRERTEERYEPSKTALRSENQQEEVSAAQEAGVAGVPGARTNLPDAADGEVPATPTPAAGAGTIRRSHTRNWEVERVTQKTTIPAGDMRRVSVAVLLNGRWETHGTKHSFVPRKAEEVAALEAVVKNAVGYDAARGDTVVVQAAQFSRNEEPAAEPEPRWVVVSKRYGFLAIAAVAALAVIVMLIAMSGRRRTVARKAELLAEAKIAALGAAGEPALAEGARHAELPAHPSLSFEEVRQQALELAAKDPARAAVVLREWLGSTSAPALPQ